MANTLAGKQALVTGGTSGIGHAIAVAFCREGANVTVTGRTEDEVKTFAKAETTIRAQKLDVTDSQQVSELAAGFNRLDILVNCAGMILRDGQEHEPNRFAEVVDVNLNGMMRVCAATRSLLVESHGCVVNIASMLSFFGSGFVPAYSASKGGVVQLTKSLAIAWASESIRVNAIAPGWIETALTKPLRDHEEKSQTIIDRTPMKRWGKSEEVAGAAVFLCSSAAEFITGVVLPVDGGYSIA